MARHKRNYSSKGFKADQPEPQTIVNPWSVEYPWSGGDSDSPISGLRQLSYKERRVFLATQTYAKYLYKFKAVSEKSIAHLEDVLLNSRLYLSSPRQFNGPFDMSADIVAKGTPEDLYAKIDSASVIPQEDKERMRAEASLIVGAKGIQGYFERHKAAFLFRQMLDTTGVASFSSSKVRERNSGPRNILMWSHYADSHRGLCFQFEIARDPLLLRELVRVRYEPRYPEVNWLSANFSEQLEGALFHKAPCWSYEHEWRFILRECANTYLPFSPEALTAVILGCEIPDHKERMIVKLIEKRMRRGLPSLRILRASRSRSEFRLKISK
jgi:hypothetical protein